MTQAQPENREMIFKSNGNGGLKVKWANFAVACLAIAITVGGIVAGVSWRLATYQTQFTSMQKDIGVISNQLSKHEDAQAITDKETAAAFKDLAEKITDLRIAVAKK